MTRWTDADARPAGVGARVRFLDLDRDREDELVLVGPEDVNWARGRISVGSPLGRALLGRRVGDHVEFRAPVGWREVRVLAVLW